MKPEKLNDGTAFVVDDGNDLLYTVNDLPQTFKEICWKVFGMISSHTCDIIFSANMFHPHSVEPIKRLRRGAGDKLIFKMPNTKKPICWKSFLPYDKNMK